MIDTKSMKALLTTHFKLLKEQLPKEDDELKNMVRIPYILEIGSLIYMMVYTRHAIAHIVEVMSRYMANPGE